MIYFSILIRFLRILLGSFIHPAHTGVGLFINFFKLAHSKRDILVGQLFIVTFLLHEEPSTQSYFKLCVLALELTGPCVWNFLFDGVKLTQRVTSLQVVIIVPLTIFKLLYCAGKFWLKVLHL